MSAVLAPPPQYREITAADLPALFYVRTRTRENAYTLEQLHRLGSNMANVATFMCDLATDATTWDRWVGRLPVIVNVAADRKEDS